MPIDVIIAIVSVFVNVLVLAVSAWIKVDVAGLKVYMHERFVTRDTFAQLEKRIDP